MRRAWWKAVAVAILMNVLCVVQPGEVWAGADYIEVLVGSGEGKLIEPQPELRDTHIVLAFGHDMHDWLQAKLGWDLPGNCEFRIEPFVNVVNTPRDAVEFGAMAALKFSADMGHIQPFVKGGSGPIITTLDTLEQSTDLNIVSYAAIGVDYMISDEAAIGIERWVRHYSNGSVRDPNDGVDSSDWLVGYTQYF